MRILKNIPLRYCVHICGLDLQRIWFHINHKNSSKFSKSALQKGERNSCAVVHNPKEKYVSLFYTVLFTKTQFQTNNDLRGIGHLLFVGVKKYFGIRKIRLLRHQIAWNLILQNLFCVYTWHQNFVIFYMIAYRQVFRFSFSLKM